MTEINFSQKSEALSTIDTRVGNVVPEKPDKVCMPDSVVPGLPQGNCSPMRKLCSRWNFRHMHQ